MNEFCVKEKSRAGKRAGLRINGQAQEPVLEANAFFDLLRRCQTNPNKFFIIIFISVSL